MHALDRGVCIGLMPFYVGYCLFSSDACNEEGSLLIHESAIDSLSDGPKLGPSALNVGHIGGPSTDVSRTADATCITTMQTGR